MPTFAVGPEANRPLLGFGSNTDRPNDPPTPQRLLFNAVRSGILPRGNAAVTISDANDGDDEATSRTFRMKPILPYL